MQACYFRDSYEAYKKAGAEVVGISSDPVDSHKVESFSLRLLTFSASLTLSDFVRRIIVRKQSLFKLAS